MWGTGGRQLNTVNCDGDGGGCGGLGGRQLNTVNCDGGGGVCGGLGGDNSTQ